MLTSLSGSKQITNLLLICLWLLAASCKAPEQKTGVETSATRADSQNIEQSQGPEQAAFQYRGLYNFSAQTEEVLAAYDIHNPDFNWELWGHNIKKIVGTTNIDVYATINGKKDKSQYCFSSKALYKALHEYVADQGQMQGNRPAHFTIMPNDNMLVCQCEECKKAGCTDSIATPAVTNLICKLAKDFPKAIFFTSAYNTTQTLPEKKLPENVGVYIAASKVQLRSNFKEKKGFAEFDNLLKQWKQKTDIIYVWDYCKNFDDYCTPFPCLEALRAHLIYYKEEGVKGIFINGSGYDYSSFDDIQTYVIAKLLHDPYAEIEPLVNDFLKKEYPKTREIISEYYLTLEDSIKKEGLYLPLYCTDLNELSEYYFKADEFEAFRTKLEKASKKVEGPERKKLNLLLTSLNFTRMQMMKYKLKKFSRQDAEDALEVMKGALDVKEIQNYKETNGKISEYIKQWEKEVLSTY